MTKKNHLIGNAGLNSEEVPPTALMANGNFLSARDLSSSTQAVSLDSVPNNPIKDRGKLSIPAASEDTNSIFKKGKPVAIVLSTEVNSPMHKDTFLNAVLSSSDHEDESTENGSADSGSCGGAEMPMKSTSLFADKRTSTVCVNAKAALNITGSVDLATGCSGKQPDVVDFVVCKQINPCSELNYMNAAINGENILLCGHNEDETKENPWNSKSLPQCRPCSIQNSTFWVLLQWKSYS